MGHPNTEANEVALKSLRKLYRAAEDLKAELSVDEASFSLIAPEAHSDSRGFYIFEALDEVQKMTCALLPLSALPGSEEQGEEKGRGRKLKAGANAESLLMKSVYWRAPSSAQGELITADDEHASRP